MRSCIVTFVTVRPSGGRRPLGGFLGDAGPAAPVDAVDRRGDVRAALDLLECPRIPATPVQAFRSGTRHVLRVGLQRNRSPSDAITGPRPGSRRAVERRFQRRARVFAVGVGEEPPGVTRGALRAPRVAPPGPPLGLIGDDQAELLAERHVGPAPEPRPGRHVVRVQRGDGLRRWLGQAGVARLLAARRRSAGAHAPSSPVARSPAPSRGPLRRRRPGLRSRRSTGARTPLLGPIADVDAVPGRGAARHPVEPMQPDHVDHDARDRGIAEERAEDLVVVAVAGQTGSVRMRRRRPQS